ncbi:Sodium-dependent phosphate transporter [Lunatimonas lonarensis]|uniref:Sodium-dependent phosphate transporter n=1 Tax=Lunatimonas lonarensis TaxID=1232681 RepID=R7ZMG6_9BACT|nr:Na/Pi symporter [Lunatimonas lonarensis]EON75290.1 Sodium-dependent phosphate transporter [Lunatimonas lonarensis]
MQTKDIVTPTFPNLLLIASALLGLLLFVFSIDLLTFSLGMLNSSVANEIFMATENPFVGLFVGILMTALIQSSSTISAMVVALVASGSLSLTQAVPLIMGANIGTTLTSNLVSLSFITQKKAFKKALSAAVLHDFFNIITTAVLFPLEVYFGFLSNMARYIVHLFVLDNPSSPEDGYTPYRFFLRPVSESLVNWLDWPFLWLIVGIILLFLSIKVLSNLAFESILAPKYKKASKQFFKQPYRAFGYGVFSTAAVQSSTITTSLIVTVVATGKATLNNVFPFIIGANIGTTITAAIAALYKTEAAISIALVHFLFNMIGALLFLPYPPLRNIPPRLASSFGKQIVKSRLIGLAYILLTFFVIPFLLIYFNKN